MKLKAGILLFVLAMLCAPVHTQAQFWKKWFQKEEKRKSKPVQKTKDRPTDQPVTKKKRKNLEYPTSRIKTRYRVDVLIPLYLDELVKDGKPVAKDKIPERAITGINFYEGVKLAADTLTALGYNIDVYTHDITQKGLTPHELVKGGVLAESDLIIGILQSNQLPAIADFARKSKINLVSVISPSDADIKDNIFFTMLQPTLEKHCERLIAAGSKRYPKKTPFLLYRTNNSTDSVAASYFLEDEELTYRKVLINKGLQENSLKRFLDSTTTNVIYMPIVDNTLAEATLQRLNDLFPNHQFEVYGMPSWKFIGGLKKAGTYPNIAINFTSPFYYDLTTPVAQIVTTNYKRQFNGRIGEMTLRGYEVFYWYAYLLQKYGTVFNARQGDNIPAVFTKFDVKPQWNRQQEFLYNENEHLFLYHYQSGSYLVESL